MKKVYYQLTLVQNSPLRITNGDGEDTDSDLMLDGRQLPFIPGSSLSGVLKYRFEELCDADKKVELDELFGFIEKNTEERSKKELAIQESKIIVGNAILQLDKKENVIISQRDGVGLNDWGTTIKGHKYDFQVVETKLPYIAILEWTEDGATEKLLELFEYLLKVVADTGLSFGARTSRGYGDMDVQIKKKEFVFPDDLENWLDFNAYEKSAFSDAPRLEKISSITENQVRIEMKLENLQNFVVRVNTAKAEKGKNGVVPNSVPLMNAEGNAVIPGTSWAGAFRHHMRNLVYNSQFTQEKTRQLLEKIDTAFGQNKDQNKKSVLSFSETVMTGGNTNEITRNAVDRFTANPREGALYTSQVWEEGTGDLKIVFDKHKLNAFVRQLLAVSIVDLSMGLLTIGGEVNVGRGIMTVSDLTVNGIDKSVQLQNAALDFLEG